MRLSRLVGNVLMAAVLTLFAAAPALAQQPAQPQMSDSAQALMMEMQQVQQKLAQIQQKALEQSPALQQQRESLKQTVEDAMREDNPQIDQKLDRMQELRSDLQAAQQAEDGQQVQQLMTEARQIQQEVQQAQAQAMEREDIAEELDAFQDRMIEEMKKVDPETEQLLARMEELAAALQS